MEKEKEESMMPLTTFGSIMGFAAELVKHAENIYQVLAGKAKDSTLREALEALSKEEGKDQALMIKTRRENVTEMILEPVAGLYREDYEIPSKIQDQREDTEILKAALSVEEKTKTFFEEVSAKIPLPEVARIFKRMARKKEENLHRLQGLGLSKTFEGRK